MTNVNIIKLSVLAAVFAVTFGAVTFVPVISEGVENTVFSTATATAFGSSGCCGGGDFGGGDGPGEIFYNPPQPPYEPPEFNPAYCDFLTASPTTLAHGGGNVTLSWGTTNATSVSIDNGVGSVAADGSTTVNVTDTTTFTLTAVGAGGNGSCTAKVTVDDAPEVAKCDFLNASDTSLPKGGANITLSWGTTNADSVSINNGIGTVAADGSTSVFVNSDTTFTLTATATGGSDSCSVTVNVENGNDVPRCDYFTVSDDDVDEGDEVTLRWGTTNAKEVHINQGIGRVSNDGEEDVRVYDDTTFTLTVEGHDGSEDTCRVEVEVDEDDDDDDPRPRCELTVSDRKVHRGDVVTLEWETRYADDVVIEDDEGEEIFDSDDYSRRYLDGEIDVRITRDTEFTLTARGDGGKRVCDVDVEVEDDDVTIFEKRDQPYVISLTQVPHTGFPAGPALTFIFYAILTLWALFVAYILVIKRSSVLGFSLYGATEAATLREDEEYKKKVAKLMDKYAHRS